MDIPALVAAIINLAAEIMKAQNNEWEAMSPEKKRALADKRADQQIEWLEFLQDMGALLRSGIPTTTGVEKA